MEEAASLFGPADSASDPFGSIVTNSTDNLAASSTSHPSEHPLSETREAEAGVDWFGGSSSHFQAEGTQCPEYGWQSGGDVGDTGGHSPHYGGSTASGFTYHQSPNPHVGEYVVSHDAGHVYGTQQHYEPSAERSSFERSSVLQSSDNSSGNPTSSALHARAVHVRPQTSDLYRPSTQPPSNSGDSTMYPNPPFSYPYDRTAAYSAYQPVANNSHSVPQPVYQPYSARSSPLPPQVTHTQLGTQDKPPDSSQTMALYRPKTTNAYDPPIPPPKPSRHVSGALGSSRVFSPTGATQAYAAQDTRHVPYHTNPSQLSPPDRYTSQIHLSAPPVATHPPSNAQPATNISPPRRGPHPRTVPGSSIPAESSPYSVQLDSESPYPHRNTFDHVLPQHVPSIDAVAGNIPSNQLGYPAPVQPENEVLTPSRADNHHIQPGRWGEFPTRGYGPADTSLSANQYSYPDTGRGFVRHPTTNSSYSPEAARSLPAPIHASSHDSRSTRSSDLASPPPSTSNIATGSTSHAPVSVGPSSESEPVLSRVSSPASNRSWKSSHVPPYDPYAPARNTEPFSSTARDRSMSSSSLVSSRSSVTSDPYVPSRLDLSHDQTLILPAQTHAPYAPSPSLLGSNDPLGRTSSRAPVVSFGFGGKLVLCFHGSNTLNTGFDIALSSRQTTGIQLRPLHTAIPESALDYISIAFPGPLFCDPGSPAGLVRAAVATQSKSNKAKVIKYLDVRAEEISRGLGYLSQGSSEHRRAEGKLILVKLLRVLLEQDGHLSGSPQVEAAVRAALVPRLSDVSGLEQSTAPKTALYGLDSAATSSLALSAFDPHDRVLSVQTVKASALDRIQELLIQGDRRAAYRYALDEQLWAHAMIIASSVDKETWKEVINEFIRSELNTQSVSGATGPGQRDATASSTGREPLKVAYSLYSGQGAASIQALVPPSSLIKMGEKLQPPALSHITPITPNLTTHTTTVPIPADVLKKWPDTAAMLIPGPSATECSAALLALGDSLLANHLIEAAHACYLIAPQSGILGNIGSPGRITLVGSRGPTAIPNFHVSDDAIVFSEIVEFALSLAPSSKGQESFNGLPRLQTYKFVRAVSLAEMGHMLAATRYCEAIAACLSRTQTLPLPELSEQLKEFTDRLVGAPHLDKTGSWIGGKMTRPSLDSLGNWLGGRLTEFVAGGNDSPTTNGDTTPHETGRPSPQPTVVNHYTLAEVQSKLPRRTGSAQAVRLNSQTQIDRASSAMEYRPIYRNSSPTPRIASANAATTSFSQASSNYNGYSPANVMNDPYQRPENKSLDGDARASPWWDSSNTEESNTTTPTVTMFPNDRSSSPSGFVSLMDVSPPIPAIPASSVAIRSPTFATQNEDEDDLGLGNSSNNLKVSSNESGTSASDSSAPESKPIETETRSRPGNASKLSSIICRAHLVVEELKPNQQSSSWFSRWWNKEGSSGPVKATLGEDSSFVYDKELKRWVNKKVSWCSGDATHRSSTATFSGSNHIPRLLCSEDAKRVSLAPPPARAASAIDLTASPPKRTVPRPRSALPPVGDGVPNGVPPPGSRITNPPSPGPSGSPTPPPSRPRSQATKRNLRSRYVDVFQQPSAET
ncbi:Sec23-binding domain of Sec16-domain-containing protein [Russula compacta]|nr:Sec23-binding domain of Sec16-domain-containing protein [Russula compacta]